jgi:hypothetical protein
MKKVLCQVLILFFLANSAFPETSDTDFDALFSDERKKTPEPVKEKKNRTSDADLEELFSDEKKKGAPAKEEKSATSDSDLDDLFSDDKVTTPGPVNKVTGSDADLDDLFSGEKNTTPKAPEDAKLKVKSKETTIGGEIGKEVVEADDSGFFNDIEENLAYELKLFGSQFDQDLVSNVFVDDAQRALLARLEIETSASINKHWSFKSSLLATYSTGIDDLQGVFYGPGTSQREARILEVKEAYLMFEEKEYDVVIGRSLLSVGLAELFSPANRYGLVDAINPNYTQELGVWKTTVNYYIEDDSISYSILPYHERSPAPTGRSRWLGGSGDPNFFGLPAGVTGVEEEFNPVTDVASWGHLLQYNAVREGYDYFFLIHHGPSTYFALSTNTNANKKTNPLAWTLAGGLAKTIEEWKLYTEASYQNTNKNQDEDFVKYVVGISYRETEWAEKIGLEEISPVFEYAGEIVTNPQLAENFIVNSKESRPGRNTVISKIDFRKDDEYSFTIFATHNISTDDTLAGGYLEYSYNDNLAFQLERRWFRGDDTTQFGRYNDNDFTGLSMQYKF